MKYNYHNSGLTNVIAINKTYAGIETPDDLYRALDSCWTVDTCTERLREKYSSVNKTCGQCAITAFLFQDIFGGQIYGMKTKHGKHWYNYVGGEVIDLTCEQFGEDAKDLVYDISVDTLLDTRESIWNETEKKERYLLLKANLEKFCS